MWDDYWKQTNNIIAYVNIVLLYYDVPHKLLLIIVAIVTMVNVHLLYDYSTLWLLNVHIWTMICMALPYTVL